MGAVLEGPNNGHVDECSNLTLTLSSIEQSISSAPRDETQDIPAPPPAPPPAPAENGSGSTQEIVTPKKTTVETEHPTGQLPRQVDASKVSHAPDAPDNNASNAKQVSGQPRIEVTSKEPPTVYSTAEETLTKLSHKISTDPAMKDPKRIIASSEFLAAKAALVTVMKDAKNLTDRQRRALLNTIMSLQAILVAGGSKENLFALIKKNIDPTENDSISKIIDWMTCDATSTPLIEIQQKYLASKSEIDRIDPNHNRLTALLLTKAKKEWDIKKTNNDINGALAVYEMMIANTSLPMNTRIFLNQSLAQQLTTIKQPELARAVLGRLTGYQAGITNYNAWSDATSFWNFGTTRVTLQNISLKSETPASDESKRILYKAFQDQIACFDAKKMTTPQWNSFFRNVSGSLLSLDHKQALYVEAMQKKLLNGESNEATFSALRNLAINPKPSVKNKYRIAFALAEHAKNAGNRPLMESWLSFAVSCVNKFAPSEKNSAKFETSVRLIQQFEWTTKGTDLLNELLTIPGFKQQVLKIPELNDLIGTNQRFDPTKVSDSKRVGRALEKALDVSGQSSLAAQAAAVGTGSAIGAAIGVWGLGVGAIPGALIGGIVGDLSLRAYNVITNASAISDIYQSGYDGISDFQTLMNGAGLLSSVLGLSKGVGLASKGMKFLRLADTCLTVGLMGTPQAISLYQYSQGQITGEQWRDGLVTQLETFAVMFAAGAIGTKIGMKSASGLKVRMERRMVSLIEEPDRPHEAPVSEGKTKGQNPSRQSPPLPDQNEQSHPVNTPLKKALPMCLNLRDPMEPKSLKYLSKINCHAEHKVVIDGTEFYLSRVYLASGRKHIVGYSLKNGKKMPLIFYKSMSDGGWRLNAPCEYNRLLFSKGKSNNYFAETKLHPDFQKEIAKIEEYYPEPQTLETLCSFDLIPDYRKDAENQYGQEIKPVSDMNLESLKAPVERITVYKSDFDRMNTPQMIEKFKEITPDFIQEQPVETYSETHTLLGAYTVKVYKKEINGQSYFWHMASTSKNEVWVRGLYKSNNGMSRFGTNSEFNAIPLIFERKPCEYESQIDKLYLAPNNNLPVILTETDRYRNITPILREIYPIKGCIRNGRVQAARPNFETISSP